MLALDFETAYDDDYSVTTSGPENYVRDSHFSAYWVAIHSPDYTYSGPLSPTIEWSRLDGQDVCAHNARFDKAVFDRCVELGQIPKVTPRSWTCTADLSAFIGNVRSLEDATKYLLGLEVDKSMRKEMKGITYDAAIKKGLLPRLEEYGRQDSTYCYMLWERYAKEWPDRECKVSGYNREWGTRGLFLDSERASQYKSALGIALWETGKRIPWDWEDGKTPLSPTKLKAECKKSGIEAPSTIAEDEEEYQLWEVTYGEKISWVRDMRRWRKLNILQKKLKAMMNRQLSSSWMPYELLYFGAHTGRFKGAGGLNVQNFCKDPLDDIQLRHVIVAPPGYKLCIADLGQIEYRINLWLSNDAKTLAKIQEGMHPYVAHAIESLGWKGGDIKKEDPNLYNYSKARCLALGFSAGWKTFQRQAKVKMGLDLTDLQAQEGVQSFRYTNPKIVNTWQKFGRGLADNIGGTYEVVLPSGRSLKYRKIKSQPEMTAEISASGRQSYIYGGKVTENVVQAIARDVFVEHLVNIHEVGIPVLMHEHDKGVFMVKNEGEVNEVKRLMAVTPEWLEGCPLTSDVEVTPYFK